jgi:DNA-binding transcriptional MerR regulator
MLDAKQIAEIVRSQDHDDEVSPSTLHYYVQVGVLPPAVGRGRSGYTPEHLTRFRLARYLKRRGLGLAEIRERITGLTPEAAALELAGARETVGAEPIYRTAQARGRLAGARRPLLADAVAHLTGPAEADVLPPSAPVVAEPMTRYSIAADALRVRPGQTPRTLRFKGGFSLQVPAGTGDEQIARLYTAIEAVLSETEQPSEEDVR